MKYTEYWIYAVDEGHVQSTPPATLFDAAANPVHVVPYERLQTAEVEIEELKKCIKILGGSNGG